MNNFVVCDIHGEYKLLKKLLDHLDKNYGNDYKLYIGGDIIDRGFYGYNIFKLITSEEYSKKVELIQGNHEALLCRFVKVDNMFDCINIVTSYFHEPIGTKATILGIIEGIVKEKNFKYQNLDKCDTCKQTVCKIIDNYYSKTITGYVRDFCGYNLNNEEYNACLLGTYDKLKEMADYFDNLPLYKDIKTNDKYLIVHSGFVNSFNDINLHESVRSLFKCKEMSDLKNQNPFILLGARALDVKTDKYLLPNKRFDDRVIVSGHTPNLYLKTDKAPAFDTIIKKVNNKIVSIALDGSAQFQDYDEEIFGQLNCINLNDLSQIVIKNVSPYMIKEIPYEEDSLAK